MPSSFSPNRSYQLMQTGEDVNTWGINTNANLSQIDENLGGTLNISVAGSSNITLTSTQAANLIHNLSGALTGNINYIFPDAGGFFAINNQTTGAFTVTVTVSGGSGGIIVPQGTTSTIYIDASVPAVRGFTGSQSQFVATSVVGTANAIVIPATVPSNFALTQGVQLSYIPTNFNTGPVTIQTPDGSVLAIDKFTPAGLTAFTGEENIPGFPRILSYNGTLWIDITQVYYGFPKVVSTNQAVSIGNTFLSYIATTALSLTISRSATTLPNFWWIEANALGGNITIVPDSNDSINVNGKTLAAGATYQIVQGASCKISTDANGNLYILFIGNLLNAEQTLASATTTNLGNTGGNIISITGTTTITGLGSSASASNPFYITRFTGALTLTYNATNLIIPGAVNYTTTAGDVFMWKYEGSGNWRCVGYSLISGKTLVGNSVTYNSVSGCLLAAIAGTSTTATITVGSGQAADSANSVYITSAGYSWAVTNGNAINGYSGGTTLPNSSTIHMYICTGTSGTGTYAIPNASYPLSAGSAPSGYQSAVRRIGSFNTNISGAPIPYTSLEVEGGTVLNWLGTQLLDVNVTNLGTSRTLYTLTVPIGIKLQPIIRGTSQNTGQVILTSGDETDVAPASSATAVPLYDWSFALSNSELEAFLFVTTNTSGQIGARCSTTSGSLNIVTRGWKDFRRS